MGKAGTATVTSLALLMAGCSYFENEVEPPPRSTDLIETSEEASTVAADVDIGLATLRSALEAEIPRQLWTIDQQGAECIAPRRTTVIGIAIKSPTIRCDLDGQVTRGRLKLSGAGQDLIVTMPLEASVTASDIGGLIKQQTGTAQATVTARVRPTVQRDWRVRGDVAITYDWNQPPTVSLAGREITFARQADERLAKVVQTLERTLEREIAKLNVRKKVEPLWDRSFVVLSLNQENPPVWLRVTPRSLGFDGYTASRTALSLKVRLNAKTEIFVGDQPPPAEPVSLPDMQSANAGDGSGLKSDGLNLTLPVVAQYAELEPVLLRALERRAERPFLLPELGERQVEFRSVTVYGTSGNRVAVGVEFEAWKLEDRGDSTTGMVWLTALPQNEQGSRIVEFVEPEYQAQTSRFTTNILLEIAKTQDFSEAIEGALTQNFERDYEELLEKVETALRDQRMGDFVVSTRLNAVSTGTIKAYGEGLYLPVTAKGDAQIKLRPR